MALNISTLVIRFLRKVVSFGACSQTSERAKNRRPLYVPPRFAAAAIDEAVDEDKATTEFLFNGGIPESIEQLRAMETRFDELAKRWKPILKLKKTNHGCITMIICSPEIFQLNF